MTETTDELLTAHQERYVERVRLLEVTPSDEALVLSYEPDHSRPRDADAVSHRFSAMCQKLGIDSHLHALRSALLSNRAPQRRRRRPHRRRPTWSRRWGYDHVARIPAWVAESDKRAAEILADGMLRSSD